MAETIHTFTGGMDLDTDKAFRNPNTTLEVRNFRLITDKSGSTESLEVVKGNEVYHYPTLMDTIYGYCHVGTYLVLFGKLYAHSVISKITLNDKDEFVSEEELYSDAKNNNTGLLNFTTDIKCVGREESAGIIKVYWIDGTNHLRYINIAIHNTTDGQAYSGTNFYVAPDKLELAPNAIFNALSATVVKKGGSLKSGVVRYVYQFYNKYGVESLFSVPTNPIHLVESVDNVGTSTRYEGSDADMNVGKSVEIVTRHVAANNHFDHLKIIRIHYSTFGGNPTISLVADIELEKYFNGTYKTYTVLDTGVSLYEYLPEEITVFGNILFSASDIATKDDMLFCSNITENSFDVEFDARAFRFPSSSTTFYITNDGINRGHTLSSENLTTWDTLLATVREDNDCINLLNDLTYDNKGTYSGAEYNCQYMYNSTVLGGTGRNVKYQIITEEMVLDSASINVIDAENDSARTLSCNIGGTGNNSFKNYASPFMSQTYRGYQRGETYRFGIVFFDAKGRPSKAKWIGDIRFPNFSNAITGYKLAQHSSATSEIKSDILGVQFYVRNVPSEAVAWSIVRMDRKDSDRTIVSQGVISSIFYDDGNDYHLPLYPTLKATGTAYGGGTLDSSVLMYASPDINYGTLDYKQGDYFEEIGQFNVYGTYVEEVSTPDENVIKYMGFDWFTNRTVITPNNIRYTDPTNHDEVINIGGKDVHTIISYNASTSKFGILGTSMLFTYSVSGAMQYGTNTHSPVLVNLRRVNASQYGGNTYEARMGNEYISCGVVATLVDTNYFTHSSTWATPIRAFGGDTFICMYERLNGMFYNPTDYMKCRVAYIPLESKYNLQLNSGTTYSKSVGKNDAVRLISETAGDHATSPTNRFVQDKDFYIYNTVYSYNGSPVAYFSKSNLDNEIVRYNTRVIVSDRKYNNEIVDSWAKFGVNNFIDVDSTYGPLNNLVMYRGKLYFLQEKAFGGLSVNDRAVVVDSQGASQLVVGTGGILDRYDYFSTYFGNSNLRGVVACESGIYWIDNNHSDLVLFNGQDCLPLSKQKKIDTFFKQIYNQITSVRATYQSKYNEVWFAITTSTGLGTLVFSELMNCFTGFYDNNARIFIPLDRKLLSIYNAYDVDYIYEEDRGRFFGEFFSSSYQSKIRFLHTDNYPYMKVYDNVEFASSSKDVNGVDIYRNTFNNVTIWNDYQNTGYISFMMDYPNDTAQSTPIRRRERKWTFAVPRNRINKSVNTNPNIQNISNLSVTQLHKDRIRNDSTFFEFGYGPASEYIFSVPYIKIIYRISKR